MERMKELGLVVLVGALAGGAYAQGVAPLPMAPGAQVTTLSAQPGTWSEPSVAVNPRNPQQVLAVFQYVAQAGYSSDAGRTWKLATGVAAANYKNSGDVSTVFDDKGHALICFISFDKLGTVNYWGHGATRNGIFVRRSLDGGATWEPELRTVVAQPTTPGDSLRGQAVYRRGHRGEEPVQGESVCWVDAVDADRFAHAVFAVGG